MLLIKIISKFLSISAQNNNEQAILSYLGRSAKIEFLEKLRI